MITMMTKMISAATAAICSGRGSAWNAASPAGPLLPAKFLILPFGDLPRVPAPAHAAPSRTMITPYLPNTLVPKSSSSTLARTFG